MPDGRVPVAGDADSPRQIASGETTAGVFYRLDRPYKDDKAAMDALSCHSLSSN